MREYLILPRPSKWEFVISPSYEYSAVTSVLASTVSKEGKSNQAQGFDPMLKRERELSTSFVERVVKSSAISKISLFGLMSSLPDEDILFSA